MKGVTDGTHSYIYIYCSRRRTLIDGPVNWSGCSCMCYDLLTTRFTYKIGTLHRTCCQFRQQDPLIQLVQRLKGQDA
jgi:hypothetical protein